MLKTITSKIIVGVIATATVVTGAVVVPKVINDQKTEPKQAVQKAVEQSIKPETTKTPQKPEKAEIKPVETKIQPQPAKVINQPTQKPAPTPQKPIEKPTPKDECSEVRSMIEMARTMKGYRFLYNKFFTLSEEEKQLHYNSPQRYIAHEREKLSKQIKVHLDSHPECEKSLPN